MKTIFVSFVLVACLWRFSATTASAVTFTNLYEFSADAFVSGPNPQATNGDGVNPDGFVLSGNVIYGTASAGGLYGYGTLFRVNTDGSNFTNLFNFNIGTFDPTSSTYLNSTGDNPNAGLTLISNTLYGTTFYGGVFDAGTVFKIDTDGSNFSVIYSLNFTNGQSPSSGLTLYSNALYGTATDGGSQESGTIFRVDLSDLKLSKVCDFLNVEEPYGGVVISSNVIYGFGRYGGTSLNGVVYAAGVGGGGYVDFFSFDDTNGSGPYSTPTLYGNTLFGVTYQGGTNGGGNVFRIDTDGKDFTNLFSFQGQGGANTTGAYPYGFQPLVLSNNVLYGATSVSGSGGQGTVFQLNTDGTGFTVLHSFDYSDGAEPGPVVLSGGVLYGMTDDGFRGISLGDGGIFALILQPSLNIELADHQAVLTWNDPSYFLYSGLTLTNITTKIVGATSPYTNSLSDSQEFFELRSE